MRKICMAHTRQAPPVDARATCPLPQLRHDAGSPRSVQRDCYPGDDPRPVSTFHPREAPDLLTSRINNGKRLVHDDFAENAVSVRAR